MVKKIKSDQLKPGMYIHDLNCSWLDHPFFGSSLKIKDRGMIDKIIRFGIRDLYIDTDKGLDVDAAPEKGKDVKEEREEIENTAESEEIDFDNIQPVPVREEMCKARRIREEALQTVQNVMSDIKLGNQIEKDPVIHTVDEILGSILRNKDALTGLGRLRKTDEYLYNHSLSVCALMVSFGKFLGFDPGLLKEVGVGALLHDIGTMKIPAEILGKKSALSEEEYSNIKEHVHYGRGLLEETEGVSETSIITAYQHHERIDGSGYPHGLKGDKISYTGQAIAIVDVYDALTTKRCYRRRIPPTQALQMLYEWGGTKFNTELVQKFIRCVGIYPVGSLVRLESGLIGVVVNHSEESLLQPVIRVIYNTKRESYVTLPYDIDLSNTEGKREERISGYEMQEEWNIQPEMYL